MDTLGSQASTPSLSPSPSLTLTATWGEHSQMLTWLSCSSAQHRSHLAVLYTHRHTQSCVCDLTMGIAAFTLRGPSSSSAVLLLVPVKCDKMLSPPPPKCPPLFACNASDVISMTITTISYALVGIAWEVDTSEWSLLLFRVHLFCLSKDFEKIWRSW